MPRKRANGKGTIRKRTLKHSDGSTYTHWFARVTTGWDGSKKTTRDGPLRKRQNEGRADLAQLQRQQKQGLLANATDQTIGAYLTSWLEPPPVDTQLQKPTLESLHSGVGIVLMAERVGFEPTVP